MRCSICGRDNDASRLFCSECAAELTPGAAREVEPPRARNRRGRWLQSQNQRLTRTWEDLGYSLQRARPDWQGLIGAAKRAALIVASAVPGLGHLLLGRQRAGLIFLGAFLLPAVCWLAFIGTAFAGLMVFGMASVAFTSVVDCVRVTYDGPRARPRLSHVFWGIAVMCGVYAAGVWLLSLRWERTIVNMDIVRLSPPRTAAAPVFHAGDRLLVTRANRWSATPERGDVVLARVNGLVIQRIIAVPGDELEFARGRFWVNGSELDQQQYPIQPTQMVEVHGEGHVDALPWSGVVADGTFVVWGLQGQPEGNAAHLGPTTIRRHDIIGKVWVVYSPYRDRRIVNHASPAIMPAS